MEIPLRIRNCPQCDWLHVQGPDPDGYLTCTSCGFVFSATGMIDLHGGQLLSLGNGMVIRSGPDIEIYVDDVQEKHAYRVFMSRQAIVAVWGWVERFRTDDEGHMLADQAEDGTWHYLGERFDCLIWWRPADGKDRGLVDSRAPEKPAEGLDYHQFKCGICGTEVAYIGEWPDGWRVCSRCRTDKKWRREHLWPDTRGPEMTPDGEIPTDLRPQQDAT